MKQHRKFILVLPILIVPFLTLLFWALGGGQGAAVRAGTIPESGLLTALPDPHFDEKEEWNKLSLYEEAARESNRFEEARESDPYFDLITFQEQNGVEEDKTGEEGNLIDSFPNRERSLPDANEEKVNQKLEQLMQAINQPAVQSTVPNYESPLVDKNASVSETDPETDRLEQLMESIHAENQEPDAEMQQIESVLDKILDIQHPERMQQKLNATAPKEQTLPVAIDVKNTVDSFSNSSNGLSEPEDVINRQQTPVAIGTTNAFFGLNDTGNGEPATGNTIQAVIHDTQELVAGATVRMRLLTDITIQNYHISRDQFIYGVCAIKGERLTIEAASVRVGNTLLPVKLTAFDLDGMEGIYIPGAITRDAAKQASDNALQSMQLMSLDPSIGAQAAGAGIEAAKGLFSKKAKLIKVTVKSGYRILLKDASTNTSI